MSEQSIDQQTRANDGTQPGAPPTIAEALGQIVWLLSQSPLHREIKIKDLESTFIPPILCGQFRVFRFGPFPGSKDVDLGAFGASGWTQEALEQLPLGVAIWAKLSEAAEAKLEKGERLGQNEWQSGDRVWLVELLSPFANQDNKLSEAMLQDLAKGPFKHVAFNFHRADPTTGRRATVRVVSHVQAPLSNESV